VLFGCVATFGLTHLASVHTGEKVISFYDNLTLNVALESVGVFVLVKNIHWNPGENLSRIIVSVSTGCFGIYMVHMLLLFTLVLNQINVSISNPISSILLLSLFLFLASAGISLLIKKIPVFNRYIL